MGTLLFAVVTVILQIAAIHLIDTSLLEYTGLVILILSLNFGITLVVIGQEFKLEVILKDMRLLQILHNRHVSFLNEMMEESKPIKIIGEQADSKFKETFKEEINSFSRDYGYHPFIKG